MPKPDGGPAFSRVVKREVYVDGGYREQYWPEDGMSLRDYFAAQAMSGIAEHPGDASTCLGYINERARVAYAIADAMLAARAIE